MNVKYLIKFISIFIIFLSYPFNLHSKLSDEEISLLVDNMSVKELLGQKFIIGPPWILPEDSNYSKYEDNDINSRSILDELIFDLKIGNFYISKSNYLDWMSYINDNRCLFSSVSDYPRMNYGIISYEINSILSKMHSSSNGKVEPLIFTDLEGGRVQGIRGGDIPETASPMSLSTTRNLSIIQSHSNAIAEMLSNLNITTNFAPVVDINYEGYQSLIGTRAFGSDGKLVKPAARAFILGQLQGGVAPVLKHWPGHGKVSNMLPNTNLDQNFHLLEEPLNVDINLSTQQDIYKDLLNDEIIRNFTAVMTSHLKVEDFKNICTQGSELMMITYCKKAIDKIRKCYNFENGVIISDDISYLKATYKKSLYDSIIDTFKSGHDMVTIASLVPYYYTPEYNSIEKKKCSENYNLRIGMNNFRKTFERLVIYYSDDDKRCELKKSVERIIRWKRNINILRKIHGSGELANDAMKEINSLLEVEKKDYSLKKNDYIFDYLNKNYEYISKNSMILISPRDINTDDFSQYLGIERVNSKILAIGPTLNTNDMKLYLEKENFRNVINVDLSYRDSDLEDPEKFIKKYTEYIKLLIRKQAPDYFIYGLVNKPSHLQIWKNIRSYIKDNNCKIKILLIVFHAPSILNSDDFEKDDFVISTFSNQKYPNKIIVELINGNDSINLKDPSYLPVAIPPIYPDVLENIQTQDYSLISDGFNTLKKKYDEYNQSLIIDNNENEYIKTNTLDLSPSAGVGNLKNNNKVIHKNKPNTMLFYAQYYLAPLSGFLIAISIFYSLKLDTKLTIICFVASIFIYISMYDFMIEVLSNKIESEDLMKRSQNPGVRAGSAFLSPFILYWIIQKIGFIFAVKKSVN